MQLFFLLLIVVGVIGFQKSKTMVDGIDWHYIGDSHAQAIGPIAFNQHATFEAHAGKTIAWLARNVSLAEHPNLVLQGGTNDAANGWTLEDLTAAFEQLKASANGQPYCVVVFGPPPSMRQDALPDRVRAVNVDIQTAALAAGFTFRSLVDFECGAEDFRWGAEAWDQGVHFNDAGYRRLATEILQNL